MEVDDYAKVLATNLTLRVLISEMTRDATTAALVETVKRLTLQAAANAAAKLHQDEAGDAILSEMHAEIAQLFSLTPIERFEG